MKTKNKPLMEKDICFAGMYHNKTRVILPEDVLSAFAGLKEEMQDNGITIHYVDKWFPIAKEKPRHGGGCCG